MGTVTLSDQQQRRAEILSRLSSGSLSVCQAASLLGITERQVRRLRYRFKAEGFSSVAHGNQGKTPHNKLDTEQRSQVLTLAGLEGPYFGFSVCHLTELLQERHDIILGRSTLDRLLREEGIIKRRGRGKAERRHALRMRQPAEGMLLQIDGSPHLWLEERGPRLCLMGAIDDATGKVLYLRFHQTECQEAYLLLTRTICAAYGLPMAFYHDRHTILRSPKEASIDEELAGRKPMSQIQRVLHELGVESIAALSPQAKGRIERLWKTLQDRLVKEMRLTGAATLEAANAFLPGFLERFNTRFSIAAAEAEPVWVELPKDFDWERFFSVQEFRVVRSDQTLSFLGKTLLIEGKRSFAGQRIAVHLTPEGNLRLFAGDNQRERLEHRVIDVIERMPAKTRPTQPNPADPELLKIRPDDAAAEGAAKKHSLSPGQAAWLYGKKWM